MLRPAALDDELAFIMSSWLQSFATSDVALGATPKTPDHCWQCTQCNAWHLRMGGSRMGIPKVYAGKLYWSAQRRLIAQLIGRGNVSVLESEDGLIDGWVCREKEQPVVHYWYVRNSSRGKGVTRELMPDIWVAGAEIVLTHKPRGLDIGKLPRGWRYSDYWLKGAE